ncbi:uncharacterized protein LOC128741059 [Sabethes cyaneus]|uniref:uncharacterized protein LOC128741059 n=1 Tax=Sabethes cyaneus TaxID=53552 RepID=UPI00237DB46D|nr:uncharacterized protein LOC128741059 [Sabethes cyaneus]
MDLNVLPTELLEHILSHSTFPDLLSNSLVCVRWNRVAAVLIGRRGRLNVNREMLDYPDVVENSNRQYKAISFKGPCEKKAMRKILLICADKFTPRKIELLEILPDGMNRFYVYSQYRLIMPNLKRLNWNEFMFDSVESTTKAVTIVAPKLEVIYLFSSHDATSELEILTCDNIKRIVCTLYSHYFDDVFSGRLFQLEILCLYGGSGGYDFTFIERIPKLRWFEAHLRPEPDYLLPNLSSLYKCKNLESLMISFSNLPHGTLDLSVLCHHLVNLKQIHLSQVLLRNSGAVRAERLVFLRIEHAKFEDDNDSLLLIAPKLETLSLTMSVMAKTRIDTKSCVKKLYINMENFTLKDALDLYLQPFIQSNETVRELTLWVWHGNSREGIPDEKELETTLLHIERLEICHLHIGLNFFRSIARCQSLKHLSLVLCSIHCNEDDADIHLAGLDSMNVDMVKVEGSYRYRFPLIAGSEEQLRGRSCIFSTHDYQFRIPVSFRFDRPKQFVTFDSFDP